MYINWKARMTGVFVWAGLASSRRFAPRHRLLISRTVGEHLLPKPRCFIPVAALVSQDSRSGKSGTWSTTVCPPSPFIPGSQEQRTT